MTVAHLALSAPKKTRRIAGRDYDLDALFARRLDPMASGSLSDAFARYRARVPKPYGWWDEVLARAAEASSRCVAPSMIFALPTRNRTCTSQAVDALRQACPGAFVVVYHNFTRPPRESVAADLSRLRDRADVLVVERAVDRSTVIGESRAFAVDVALALAAWGGRGSVEGVRIGSADADITGFLDEATYARVGAAFAADARVVVTTHRRYVELEGLAADVNLLLLGMLDNLSGHVSCFERRVPCPPVGAASVFDATWLCRVGGVPPVAVGEDLLMADAVERLDGEEAGLITIPENGVFCDHRAQFLDLENHYNDWTRNVECDEPEVPRCDVLRPQAETFLRHSVATIFLAAARVHPGRLPRLMGEIESCTAGFERLARALPSMSMADRRAVARAAMADPRRVPSPC